jgi:hypothetical protein
VHGQIADALEVTNVAGHQLRFVGERSRRDPQVWIGKTRAVALQLNSYAPVALGGILIEW